MHVRPSIILCILWFLGNSLMAQEGPMPRSMDIYGLDQAVEKRLRRSLKVVKSQEELEPALERFNETLVREGWLEFQTDSILYQASRLEIQYHQGPRYFLEEISLSALNKVYFNRAGFDRLNRKPLPLDWSDIDRRLAYCLSEFQNDGYPFAAFENLQVAYQRKGPDSLMTAISYEFVPGPYVKMDSISIKGNIREKDAFVYSLMRISPGDPYDQKTIDDIPRILNNSIYYQKVGEPEVSFSPDGKAHLQVAVQRQKSGKFDLLLGILPSSDPTDRKLEITGLVDVVLVSPFRMGELLQFKYNKLTQSSQELDILYRHPNLFRTRVSAAGEFHLFVNRPQEAEAFLNRDLRLSIEYPLSPFFSANFFFRSLATGLLDTAIYQVDTAGIPALMGGNSTLYGGGFVFDNLDYRRNPRRGLLIHTSLGLGKRIAQPDKTQLSPEVIAQIKTSQAMQEADLSIQWFIPTFRKQTLLLANRSYWLGQDQYYLNDLRQVGGGKSIRGFDENQFYTSAYTFFTAEYRLLLDRNSYLFAFSDFAILENAVENSNSQPIGLGLGMSFDTKSVGILSITYAVGKVADQGFQPSRGKIHIGFINRF